MGREAAALRESVWSTTCAQQLAQDVAARRGGTITWLNHYSAVRSMEQGVDVSGFTYIGIDGILLRRLVAPKAPRTSADLVLPLLLERTRSGCRVALIGSTAPNLRAAISHLESLPSRPRVVYARDGYDGLSLPAEAAAELCQLDVEVVIVGLGAPLQDRYVLELAECGLTGALLATCGGWLDQVTQPTYYPGFAYRIKLNWLIRLAREPRRLWRRYTVDAVRAYRRRSELWSYVRNRGERPFDNMVQACTSP